jgi:hypothetical protein
MNPFDVLATYAAAYKKCWLAEQRERWGIAAFNLRPPNGSPSALFHVGTRVAGRAISAVRHLHGPGELWILQSDRLASYSFVS